MRAVLSARPSGNSRSMKVAIVKERRAFERRVAASPDTVKRMVGMRLEVVAESGAGEGACFTDASFAAAGASIAPDAAAALDAADIVLKVQRPLIGEEAGSDELGQLKRGAVLIGLLQPLRASCRYRSLRQRRDRRVRHRAAAAHYPRAGDGRSVLPGQPRRLQSRARGRRRVRPSLSDDDDRRRAR